MEAVSKEELLFDSVEETAKEMAKELLERYVSKHKPSEFESETWQPGVHVNYGMKAITVEFRTEVSNEDYHNCRPLYSRVVWWTNGNIF